MIRLRQVSHGSISSRVVVLHNTSSSMAVFLIGSRQDVAREINYSNGVILLRDNSTIALILVRELILSLVWLLQHFYWSLLSSYAAYCAKESTQR